MGCELILKGNIYKVRKQQMELWQKQAVEIDIFFLPITFTLERCYQL